MRVQAVILNVFEKPNYGFVGFQEKQENGAKTTTKTKAKKTYIPSGVFMCVPEFCPDSWRTGG